MCAAAKQYVSVCETECEIIKATYTWVITHFSFLTAHTERKIKSSVFSMGDNGQYKWRLRLYPNGCEQGSEGTCVALFLQMVSASVAEVLAKFDFAIIKADGCRHKLASHKIRNYSQWKSLGYHELIERAVLLDPKNGLMFNDCLKLVCEVVVYTGKRINKTSLRGVAMTEMSGTFESNLARSMGSLLLSQQYSDASLRVGDKRFPVHKVILSARSPVFAAMFEHDMQEAQQNEVLIADVEEDVLGELLRFVYTGRAERLEGLASGLLAAADKYAIDDLKALCERVMFRSLTLNNAMSAYILADRHNSPMLKEQALAFMKANSEDMVDTFTHACTNLVRNPDNDSESNFFNVLNK